MTLLQNIKNVYLTIKETSAPSNPDAGDQCIFIDPADHKLKRKDSSGAVVTIEGGSVANSASFFVDEATKTVGNAFTISSDAGQRYGWWQYQNAAADGDTWTMPFFLAAGTYTIYILGYSWSSRGIQDVYIDDVKVGSIDWYSSGSTNNAVKTISSVSVSTSGTHVFKSVVNGKNASSSNYQVILTKVWIQ